MFKLRLYKSEPYSAVDDSPRVDRDSACSKCELHEGCRTICMPADGTPGGLVVVGDSPTEREDRTGRPFTSATGDYARLAVARFWKGPVVWTYAVSCARDGVTLVERHLSACRPYLAQTLAEARPERVLALGERAYCAITGRKVPFMSVERPYSYLWNVGEDPVPCYYLAHPTAASLNPFIGQQFERTIKWALTGPVPPPPPLSNVVRLCRDHADTDAALLDVQAGPSATFDVETSGIQYTDNFRVLSLSVTRTDTLATYQWDEEALADEMERRSSPLRQWLADDSKVKIGHFRTFDCTSLDLKFDSRVRGAGCDTRIWHKLLKAHTSGVANLEVVSEQAGMGGAKRDMDAAIARCVSPILSALRSYKTERDKRAAGLEYRPTKKMLDNRRQLDDLRDQHPDLYALATREPDGRKKKDEHKKWAFGLVAEREPAELARYNARDTVATARIARVLLPRLARDPDLDRHRQQVVDPAERAVERVQRWGVPTDVSAVKAFDQYLTTQLEPLERWFIEQKLNPHKPEELSRYLYGSLGIKPPKALKSGSGSTDAKVLAGLRSEHPVVQKILDYRKYDGFRTKYARGMLPFIHDGRIHPTIWLDGARTGRTSVSDPPLQQIPKSKASLEGKMARSCYCAEPGFVILSLDYSQLELRIAALLSDDAAMKRIFIDGVDYHRRTAELICRSVWGIQVSELRPWHREVAKTLNFSMLYGAGDASIAAKLSAEASAAGEPVVTQEEVARVRAAVMANLTGLAQHIERVTQEAMRTGEVRTWWDGRPARRRQLWEIAEPGDHDDARMRRGKARRGAFNTGVQGTANDFCVASMAESVDWIERERIARDVQVVLSVHDQLLFHLRLSMVREVAAKARDIMQGWNSGGVPLVVDVEVGNSWGTLERYAA